MAHIVFVKKNFKIRITPSPKWFMVEPLLPEHFFFKIKYQLCIQYLHVSQHILGTDKNQNQLKNSYKQGWNICKCLVNLSWPWSVCLCALECPCYPVNRRPNGFRSKSIWMFSHIISPWICKGESSTDCIKGSGYESEIFDVMLDKSTYFKKIA